MPYYSYQRCIAVLFIFSLLLQSCRSNSRAVMDESSPHSVTSTPATASIPATATASTTATASMPSMAIGPKEWAKYFGEVGAAPPLPADIDEILESQCPFWPDKKVKDTHLLVLVPAKVDGQPFTLDLLERLIEDGPKEGGNKTDINCANNVKAELDNQPLSASYWVLMTREVLKGSSGETYDDQKGLVATHDHYEIPSVLEAATAIFLHRTCPGDRLYAGKSLHTFHTFTTRCRGGGNTRLLFRGVPPGGSISSTTTVRTATTVCRVSGSSRHLVLGNLVLLALAAWFLALGSARGLAYALSLGRVCWGDL
jgi:hypothetical protein